MALNKALLNFLNRNSIVILSLVVACFGQPARASTYTWDPAGIQTDGSGTWTTTSANWYFGGTDNLWASTNVASFGFGPVNSNPYTVMLQPGGISAAGITFQNQAYTISGNTLTLGSSPTITVNATSGGTIASVLAGPAGLTVKSNSGALVLSGPDTYTGTTTVTGTLDINSTILTQLITLNNKAVLGGSGTANSATVNFNGQTGTLIAGFNGQGSLSMGSLTVGTAAAIDVANIIQYSSSAGANAAINVTGSNGMNLLGSANSVVFYLSGPAPTGSGVIHLVKYSGSLTSQGGIGVTVFKAQPTDLMSGVSSRTSLAVSGTSDTGYIDLIYSTDYPIWTGAGGGAWSAATQSPTNWKLASNGAATNFLQNDSVVFDDSAGTVAGGTTVVTISGSGITPGSVAFNNNIYAYTLTGTSGITGQTALTKNGSGTLTIANSNAYSGGTTINAGLLNVANSSALGGVSGLNYGTFTINGGTIANTGSPGLTLLNYPMAWNGNFGFSGSDALNLGAGNVTLGTSTVAINLSGSTLSVGGPIGDNGHGYGLTETGSGVLALGGSNVYSGGTTVTSGTLAFSGSNGSVAGNIINNSAIIFGNTADGTYSGVISGNGSVAKIGTNSLTIANNQTYTGPTIISAGTVRLAAPGVTVSGFGANTTGGTQSLSSIGLTNGTWTFNSYSYSYGYLNTPVTGGSLDLTDGTSASGGNGSGEARGAFYNTPVPVNSSFKVTFTYKPGNATSNSNYDNGFAFVLQNSTPYAVGGAGRGFGVGNDPDGSFNNYPISPSAEIDYDVFQNGANSYGSTLGAATGYNINGGTTTNLNIFGGNTYSASNAINMSVTYDAAGNVLYWSGTDSVSNLTFSETKTGVNLQSLLSAGSATIGFTGANGYLDTTQTISNFAYTQLGVNALPTTSALSISKSGVLDLFGVSQTVGSLAGAGTVTNTFAGVTATLTTGGDNSSQTFSGVLQNGAGTLALSTTGGGTLSLTGSTNTFNGPTTVNGGVLFAGARNTLSPNSQITVNLGTLDVTSAPQKINSLAIGALGSLNLQLGNVLTSSGTANFAAGSTINITGTVGSLPEVLMTYSGSATGTFTNINYNGSTGMSSDLLYTSGSLELVSVASTFGGHGIWVGTSNSWNTSTNWIDRNGNQGVPGDGSRVPGTDTATFSGSGTTTSLTLDIYPNLAGLSFSNSNYTIVGGQFTMNSSTGTSSIAVGRGSQNIGSEIFITNGNLAVTATNGGTLRISGNISDDGNGRSLILNGDGSGQLILNGQNSYTGPTTINQGRLSVNGSLVSPVTVNSGGTLSGQGNLSSVNVNLGGVFSPGDAPGPINLSGSLTLLAGATMDYQLDAIGDSDLVYMPSGTLTLNGQQFTDFEFMPLAAFDVGEYPLIDAGSISGSLGASTSGTIDGLPATICEQGSELVLTVTPEPSTTVLLGACALGMLCAHLRRRTIKIPVEGLKIDAPDILTFPSRTRCSANKRRRAA